MVAGASLLVVACLSFVELLSAVEVLALLVLPSIAGLLSWLTLSPWRDDLACPPVTIVPPFDEPLVDEPLGWPPVTIVPPFDGL